MAFIYKRGKFWWVSYHDEYGKRRRESTGQTDKKIAEKLARHYTLEEKQNRLNGTPLEKSIRLEAFKNQYLSLRENKRAANTLALDKRAVESLQRFLQKDFRLDEITPLQIDRWYAGQLKNKAVATANMYFRHLIAFFSRAVKLNYISSSPCENIEKAKEAESRGRTLTRGEAETLIKAMKPAWRELTKTALYTGARRGELCRLKLEDLRLKENILIIQSNQENQTKSRKFRDIPLPKPAKPFFRDLKAAARQHKDGYLLHTENGNHWRGDWITHGFRKIADKAGIDCTFHDLRRTYGAWLIMSGADLVTVCENMGHSDISVTKKHYIHLLIDHKQAQVDKLPKL